MADGRPPPPGSPLQGPLHQSPQSNSKPSFVNLLKSNHISSNSHHSIAGDSADLRPFAKLQDGATSLNKTGYSTLIGALKIDLLPKTSSNYLINGITTPASQGQIRFAGIMNGQSSRNDSDSTPSIEDSKGLNPISIFEGKPSVLFSSSTKSLLVDKLKFVLVGKFSHGRPSLQSIKVFFMKLKLKGDCNVSSFDKKHIFIECLCKEDYYRIWLHLNWIIDGFDMRVFKWSPDFSPLRECSIVPVWIRLQGLPLYLFDTHSLLSIANSIGHPIKVDDRNVNRSMLNSARICVELDINKSFVEDVRISFLDESTKAIVDGFWVKVFYDVVPSFCSFCLHIGHDSQICKRKDSELEFELKRNMGKIITEDDGKTDQNAQLKVQGTCLKDQLAAHVLQLNVAVECPQLDDSPTSAAAHGDKLPAGDSAEGECAVGELPTGKLTGTAGDTRGLTLVSSVHSKVDTLQGANHNKGDSQQAVAVLEEQNMQQQVISSSLGGAEHADWLHNTCEHHVLRDDSNMDGSGKFNAESEVYGNSLGQTGADPGLIISIHNTTDQGNKKLASPRENGMVLTVPKDDSKQKLEVECTAVQSELDDTVTAPISSATKNSAAVSSPAGSAVSKDTTLGSTVSKDATEELIQKGKSGTSVPHLQKADLVQAPIPRLIFAAGNPDTVGQNSAGFESGADSVTRAAETGTFTTSGHPVQAVQQVKTDQKDATKLGTAENTINELIVVTDVTAVEISSTDTWEAAADCWADLVEEEHEQQVAREHNDILEWDAAQVKAFVHKQIEEIKHEIGQTELKIRDAAKEEKKEQKQQVTPSIVSKVFHTRLPIDFNPEIMDEKGNVMTWSQAIGTSGKVHASRSLSPAGRSSKKLIELRKRVDLLKWEDGTGVVIDIDEDDKCMEDMFRQTAQLQKEARLKREKTAISIKEVTTNVSKLDEQDWTTPRKRGRNRKKK